MDEISKLTPMPAYFIIKIGKELQKEMKEKEGQFYFPTEYAFMKRECQFGEIVSIGEAAHSYLPMASTGDYLLVHHFVSGKKSDSGYNFYIVGEDDDFNYYAVNAFEIPGERALAYAVAVGEEIIPTPDCIFLEVDKKEIDKDLASLEVSENGLVVPIEKEKTREDWTAIMKSNMARIQQLARNIPYSQQEFDTKNKDVIKYAEDEIKKLEQENARISKMINKRRYELYKVAAINPQWNEKIKNSFGEEVELGEEVYMLNIATRTIINFSGTDYIVADVKYCIGASKYYKQAIAKFKSTNANSHYFTTTTQKVN